jgi:thiol-disulfide isomerase/thioredoxin
MIRKNLPLLLLAASFAAFAQPVGSKAPPLSLVDLDGKPVDVAALRGKVVLLDFWASWCAPCVAGLPALRQLQQRYKDRMTIVGVALDNADASIQEPERKLKAFLAKHPLAWPVAEITPQFNRDYGAVLGLKGGEIVSPRGLVMASLPSWVVIDRDGVIRRVETQSVAEMEKEVTALAR